MKCILFFNLLLLLGLSLVDSQEHSSIQDASIFGEVSVTHLTKSRALKRVVRETFSGMSSQFVPKSEAIIISNCKANGHINEANELQSAFDEMKTCVKNKTIFVTPKDEYIANIEECSKESIKRTKSCLATDQKYYPEFMLELIKSFVNFMYNDSDIMHVDLAECLPRFNRYSVKRSYIQCLKDTAIRTHDTSQIPSSKASYCEKFIPASQCFTDMIKGICDRTSNLDQFREDFINALKGPCDKKE